MIYMAGEDSKVMSQNLEEKIELLEQRLGRLEEENQELKQRLNDSVDFEEKEKSRVSRRGFLKKLGAGAIGIGALSLTPAASKLKISSNGIEGGAGLNFSESGSKYFKISEGGPVKVNNTHLEIRSNKVVATEPVVVAAGNSKKKNLADYVCDGTNDQQTIQSALNEFSQDSGKFVRLLDGDYYLSGRLDMEGRGLRGQSMHGTVLHATNELSNKMIFGGSNDAAIGLESLQLHGHRRDNSGSYIGVQPRYRGPLYINNVEVRSFPGSGISNAGYEGQKATASITNSKIRDNGEHGIFLRYYYKRPTNGAGSSNQLMASGRLIANCGVMNNGQNGSEDYDNIWIGDDNTYGSRWFTIKGNYIEKGGNTRYGIQLHGRSNGTHVVIGNNFDAGGNTANLSDNASNTIVGNNY